MSDELVQLTVEINVGLGKVSASVHVPLSEVGARLRAITDALVAEAETIKKIEAVSPAPAPSIPPPPTTPPSPASPQDDVWGCVAANLGLDRSKLIGNRIFGFKGTSPQILNPSAFKTPNAAFRALAYLNEVGNSAKEASFTALTELADTSRIKGAAHTTIIADLKKTGMIEAKRYDDAKMVALTPKGETTARNELRFLIEPASK
jgi:DNA-binding MarR family transcriptional regulator